MTSTTSEYALRALLYLSRVGGTAVSAKEIARATGAPRNYTGKVLNALAKAGFVRSTRGPSGGFSMTHTPDSISLARIFDLFDTIPPSTLCLLGDRPCNPAVPCAAHEAWAALREAQRAPLVTATLAALLRAADHPSDPGTAGSSHNAISSLS